MAKSIKQIQTEANVTCEKTKQRLSQIESEYNRVADFAQAPEIFISDIDKKFSDATKLRGKDIPFLFLATALQVIRQYLLTKFPEPLDNQSAAKKVKPLEDKLTDKYVNNKNVTREELEKFDHNRKHQYYNPPLAEILMCPAPFDANIGARECEALRGFGKLRHRGATPGHDPILGLIFGTANIATSTLTNWRMESYHIYTGAFGKRKGECDIFTAKAKTSLVLTYTADKLLNQGKEGKSVVGASLAKEIIHLKSDVYSKHSLPLPAISTISPTFAGELASRGLDMANALVIGKQASYAIIINTIIAIVHGFFYNEAEKCSREQFEVRTRKILVWSNCLASLSNIIVTAISRDLKLLDIGGLAVTLYRLISDVSFIQKVKEEFIKNEIFDKITGDEYDFMKGDF